MDGRRCINTVCIKLQKTLFKISGIAVGNNFRSVQGMHVILKEGKTQKSFSRAKDSEGNTGVLDTQNN